MDFYRILGYIAHRQAHIAVWHVHGQINPGRIKLEETDTPPSSRPSSNYASPYSPPPIPFRRTSIQDTVNRRWSSPITTYSSLRDETQDTQPQQLTQTEPTSKATGVRFAKSPHNLTIDLPPSDPSFAMPTAHQQRTLTLSGLAFAAASGTLSGMSLVLAKAAVELLVISIDHYRTGKGSNEFTRPETWFLVLGLAVGAVLQLVYLNYSLTFASPALICPLAFCFFNLSSIFGGWFLVFEYQYVLTTDGLVFYDQFGRLKPYQIALVSVGVAVLLLGVWVVALIKPAGEGGVEVGTWVEDVDSDSECSERDTNGRIALLGDGQLTEPPEEVFEPPSPMPHTQPGQTDSPSGQFSPIIHSPRLSSDAFSPVRRRSRGPRYGTLLADYGDAHIVPTGFSIGIGAASPGFALRSESQNYGGSGVRRKSRTQSESQADIREIMSGSERVESEVPPRRQSGEGDGRTENEAEEDLRRWEDTPVERRRASWWRALFGSKDGKIRLEEGGI